MRRTSRHDHAWLYPILSLALAVSILLAFGLTWWHALAVTALLGCPLVILWGLIFSWSQPEAGSELAPETDGVTIEWIAPFYDRLCTLLGLGRAFRRQILEVAALKAGERVLDAGCGTGVWTRLAAEAVGSSGQVVGFDPGPRMIGIARRNAAREGSRATFELAAVEELPFEDASFDAALLSLVLHHLPAKVKRSGLKEIGRVLRPGGRMIVVDLDRSDSVLWRMVLWPLSHVGTSADAFEGKIPIYLREAGFEPVTVEGRWWKSLTFWRAMKPLSSVASVETPAT